MEKEFAGLTAIVTGAGSGIGLEVAKGLNNKGAKVFGFDVNQQNVEFRFQRKLLQDVDVYPDTGDIIGYNDNFYEIDNTQEAQLIAGKPQFNQSVICIAHLTRRSAINIEETHV